MIENSVTRNTVWHREPCRVMTKGDPEGWIFLSHPHITDGQFMVTIGFPFFWKNKLQEVPECAEVRHYTLTSLWHNNDVAWRQCAWAPVQPICSLHVTACVRYFDIHIQRERQIFLAHRIRISTEAYMWHCVLCYVFISVFWLFTFVFWVFCLCVLCTMTFILNGAIHEVETRYSRKDERKTKL